MNKNTGKPTAWERDMQRRKMDLIKIGLLAFGAACILVACFGLPIRCIP